MPDLLLGVVCLPLVALLLWVLWERYRWLRECRRAEERLKERERWGT